MKVLHWGLALYQPYEQVQGLRDIGVEADWGYYENREKWLLKENPDICLTSKYQNKYLRKIDLLIKLLILYFKIIVNYDVIHFHSCLSIFPQSISNKIGNLDLIILKMLKKKMYSSWWGCDIRIKDIDELYEHSPCIICPEIFKSKCLTREKAHLRSLISSYTEVAFSNGDIIVQNPKFVWMENALNTKTWRSVDFDNIPLNLKIQPNNKKYIYHSFGNSVERNDVKGTTWVKEVVQELKEEGYNIELLFFDKVQHENLKFYQMQSYLAIDQLKCGYHGSTAVECMAVGVPVLCYLRDDIENILPYESSPIVRVNKDTLKPMLIELLQNEELVKNIGNKSRMFAEANHDRMVVAKRLKKFYESGNVK